MPIQARGGKKNRKHKRNEDYCKAYKASGMEVRNKIRKLKTRIKHNPNDLQAKRRLDELTSS